MATIILIIAFGFIVAAIAKSKGYVRESGEPKEPKSKKMTYFGWWFCGAALFIVSIIYVLALPNLNAQKPVPPVYPTPQIPSQDITAELQKYKDLYDNGLISQEDYEKKKAQILNIK